MKYKKLLFIFLLSILSIDSQLVIAAKNQQTEPLSAEQIKFEKDKPKFKKYVPKNYAFFEAIEGDLNKDGKHDLVLIVKATDPKAWVINRFDKRVDRNRRGVLVYLNQAGKYQKLVQNLNCFSSEHEDGGVYFAPELFIEIEKGLLKINYGHGRYGIWGHTFRIEKQDMRLIGYDASNNFGPMVKDQVSINYLTQKRLDRENLNQNDPEKAERFKESWSTIHSSPLYLSQIKDFDELDAE